LTPGHARALAGEPQRARRPLLATPKKTPPFPAGLGWKIKPKSLHLAENPALLRSIANADATRMVTAVLVDEPFALKTTVAIDRLIA
jgi:hypothetical protein